MTTYAESPHSRKSYRLPLIDAQQLRWNDECWMRLAGMLTASERLAAMSIKPVQNRDVAARHACRWSDKHALMFRMTTHNDDASEERRGNAKMQGRGSRARSNENHFRSIDPDAWESPRITGLTNQD
jgi:hypothetical protein